MFTQAHIIAAYRNYPGRFDFRNGAALEVPVAPLPFDPPGLSPPATVRIQRYSADNEKPDRLVGRIVGTDIEAVIETY